MGKALAGKATLQRLESTPASDVQADRYHKISHDPEQIRQFFIEHFLRHYNRGTPAKQIVIDLDATDDPLHGNQEGRFFHGYLLAAELRSANIDACVGAGEVLERIVSAVRLRWPQVRIIVRADSGFAREWLIRWCEDHRVEYLHHCEFRGDSMPCESPASPMRELNARLGRPLGTISLSHASVLRFACQYLTDFRLDLGPGRKVVNLVRHAG